MPITISGSIVTGPPLTDPFAPRMLIGASSSDWNSFGSSGAAFADTESRVGGRLGVRRIFDSGVATDWKTTASGSSDIGKRVTWYSFKPDMVALAGSSGTLAYNAEVARVNALLDSMTSGLSVGHKFILTPWHEMSDNFPTTQNQADFRNGFVTCNTLIKARNTSVLDPQFKTAIIYIGGTCFQARYNLDPLWWWPGDANVDIFGVDYYSQPTIAASQVWNSWFKGCSFPVAGETAFSGGYNRGGAIQFAFDHGKPLMVGEWGTIRNHNAGTPTWCTTAGINATKDDWIKYTYDKYAELNAQPNLYPTIMGGCYFNSKVNSKVWLGDNTESWGLYEGLPSDDSYDALKAINDKYGLPNLVAEPHWPVWSN